MVVSNDTHADSSQADLVPASENEMGMRELDLREREALLHGSGPTSEPALRCQNSADRVRLRTPQLEHTIQHGTADRCLAFLCL